MANTALQNFTFPPLPYGTIPMQTVEHGYANRQITAVYLPTGDLLIHQHNATINDTGDDWVHETSEFVIAVGALSALHDLLQTTTQE